MRSLTITSAFASNHSSSTPGHIKTKEKAHKSLHPCSPRTFTNCSKNRASFRPPHNFIPKFPYPSHRHISLSKNIINQMLHTLQNSWSPSTFEAYSRAVQSFGVFCDREKIASHFRLPASEYLLSAYAASMAGRLSGNTIQKHMTALKAWHNIHNVKWRGNTHLRLIMKGAKNLTPSSSKKPPRPPIDHGMLTTLVQHLVLDDPLDAAIAA